MFTLAIGRVNSLGWKHLMTFTPYRAYKILHCSPFPIVHHSPTFPYMHGCRIQKNYSTFHTLYITPYIVKCQFIKYVGAGYWKLTFFSTVFIHNTTHSQTCEPYFPHIALHTVKRTLLYCHKMTSTFEYGHTSLFTLRTTTRKTHARASGIILNGRGVAKGAITWTQVFPVHDSAFVPVIEAKRGNIPFKPFWCHTWRKFIVPPDFVLFFHLCGWENIFKACSM